MGFVFSVRKRSGNVMFSGPNTTNTLVLEKMEDADRQVVIV